MILDTLVIGGGVAGLTAARSLAEQGYTVTLADDLFGGGRLMNIGPVAEWPDAAGELTGPELAARLIDAVLDAGVTMLPTKIVGLELNGTWHAETSDGADVEAQAVILAMGRMPDLSGAPGADDFTGRGFSTCASCDGPLFAELPVIVTGTSRWLASEAEHLAAVAGSVTIAISNRIDIARLTDRFANLANVEVIDAQVIGLRGESALESVVVQGLSQDAREIAARAIFVCDDAVPAMLDRLPDGVVDGQSEAILTLDGVRTAMPGLFAAGDVRAGSTPYLLCAAADGLRAAVEVDAFLSAVATRATHT